MEEISLYYNYYNTPIYKSQFEKTFANGGYIKIPFQSNKGLTEPNLIITNGNTNIKYKTENLYLFNNIHKIPLVSKKNKNKILPENEEDQEVFADGELVIEHISLTNEFQKVYTVFLLSYSAAVEENGSLNKNPIDLLIKSSLSMKKEEDVLSLNSLSLNHLLNIESSAKCVSNNERTVFIFKTPILTTSFDFLAETPQEVEGSSPELLFPIFKKKDYHNYKVYIQTPQDYGIILPSYTKDHFNESSSLTFLANSSPEVNSMFSKQKVEKLPSHTSENSFKNQGGISNDKIESFSVVVDDNDNDKNKNTQVSGKTNLYKPPEVAVDIGSSTNVLKTENIRLTDRLQLRCSNTGSSEGKILFEPLNILMILSGGLFSIIIFTLVIYKYNQFITLTNQEAEKDSIRCIYLFIILLLLFFIVLPLNLSWKKEIIYIGYICLIGAIITSYVIGGYFVKEVNVLNNNNNIEFFKNLTNIRINIKGFSYFYDYHKQKNGLYWVLLLLLLLFQLVSSIIFIMFSFSGNNFFDTNVYTYNKYPNEYWLKNPGCGDNSLIKCDELKNPRKSSNNGEIAGLFLIPILLLLLFWFDINNYIYLFIVFCIIFTFYLLLYLFFKPKIAKDEIGVQK